MRERQRQKDRERLRLSSKTETERAAAACTCFARLRAASGSTAAPPLPRRRGSLPAAGRLGPRAGIPRCRRCRPGPPGPIDSNLLPVSSVCWAGGLVFPSQCVCQNFTHWQALRQLSRTRPGPAAWAAGPSFRVTSLCYPRFLVVSHWHGHGNHDAAAAGAGQPPERTVARTGIQLEARAVGLGFKAARLSDSPS